MTPPPAGNPSVPVREGLFSDGDEPHLIGATCRACGSSHFPRTAFCPYCGADAVEACELPGSGRLWAWTTVTARPPGYGGPVPFGFGVVELDGNISVVTRLTEPDATALHEGQPMRLVLDEVDANEDQSVVSWAFAPEVP